MQTAEHRGLDPYYASALCLSRHMSCCGYRTLVCIKRSRSDTNVAEREVCKHLFYDVCSRVTRENADWYGMAFYLKNLTPPGAAHAT